jgi:hypothetical protein
MRVRRNEMQSVFSLFETYEDCAEAVDELIEEGFDEAEMNVIADEEVAKTHLDIDPGRADVEATDELGEEAKGLDILLGVEQPVVLPGLDDVYAAGDVATVLVKTAASPDTGGLVSALVEFGVSQPIAHAYVEAMEDGGLLFWLRTGDDRASEGAEILREHNGLHVTSHAG